MKTIQRLWHLAWMNYHENEAQTDPEFYLWHEERYQHHKKELEAMK